MYWQVYFHPVSRGGEVMLNLVMQRAKALYKSDYSFKQQPTYFIPFFNEDVTVHDYLRLDEMVVNFYLQEWVHEEDEILSDLAGRFVNRDLFKYLPFDGSIITITELNELYKEAGIDPDYYVFSDSYSDLPYDYDRPGQNRNRRPIHLLRPNGEIREISSQSAIINSITGIHRLGSRLYYPKEKILAIKDLSVKAEIINLLNELD